MTPRVFVENIARVHLQDVFNPYKDICHVHDNSNSPDLRRKQLLNLLEKAAMTEIDSIWIGRDLGYRGGRRTGLALTDDLHIKKHGLRWGLNFTAPVRHSNVKELTASIIWQKLDLISEPIFLWNIFPFHPHQPDNPFSNRPHNKSEREIGLELLSELINLLRPKKLVGLGRDAAKCLIKFSEYESLHVRHPSYGGQRDFRNKIDHLYNVKQLSLF